MDYDAFATTAVSSREMDRKASPPSALSIRKHSVPSIDTTVQHGTIHHTQITPPDTPIVIDSTSDDEQGIVFHNYLRAFYPFDPHSNLPGNDEAIRSAASLHAGDVILIHTIHANGWADGTVLTTGERGWLPTNYCEPYDHPYLRQLLTAMTQFWDLLGGSEGANLGTFIRQDYIRGLIAGVRHLLEHADCLHRDASRVQRHTGVRRMRKGLLADLSTLVQIAKRLQDTISEAYADQTIHVLLDDLMTKAFKVVTRAVGFVDVWTSETAQEKTRLEVLTTHEPITPPVDDHSAMDSPQADTYGRAVSSPEGTSAEHGEPNETDKHHGAIQGDRSDVDHSKRASRRPVSASFRHRKGSVAHRLSYVASPVNRSASSILASEQLAKVHDICISHIGAFIGHQLHARPTSEMKETTDKLITACTNMLTVIDEVRAYEAHGTISVEAAQRNLQAKLADLETSTAAISANADSDEPILEMSPDIGGTMVQLGTSLIRVTGEAVARTRSLIEQIGDFELEKPPFPQPKQNVESPIATQGIEPASPSTAKEHRLSQKPLPPPPTTAAPTLDSTIQSKDFATSTSPVESPTPSTQVSAITHQTIPVQPNRHTAPSVFSNATPGSDVVVSTIRPVSASPISDNHIFQPVSNVLSVSSSTNASTSTRDSAVTTTSETSTRATTPDHTKDTNSPNPALLNSFGSMSSFQSASADAEADTDFAESQFLQHTYANELTLNKDGQISGGSLPALVEQLTTHDTAPDSRFVSAFFVTFRLFATPCELALALIARFDYIGDSKTIGIPVRLRICNVFKGWLETYWHVEADKDALDDIRDFALHKLKPVLHVAGDRLVELVRRVTDGYANGTLNGPLVSAMGKDGMPVAQQSDQSTVPSVAISKSQLNTLRNGGNCTIVDLDPLEIARQLTLVASKVFCDIQPEELLGLEWCKKGSTIARNVRALCNLNTDVANVVSDSILAPDNAKQRALVIKHWTKVAKHCLELNNYETLMAVICSLNLSVVQRLKRTWQLVSKNTKDRLDELNTVIDMSRNQASLRKRLEEAPVPCLPFLGLYLTDLTFVDAGNPKTRELPGSASENGEPISVINFDKYMRTARIISGLRRFQVPYKIQPVPELQAWIEGHMERMRSSSEQMVGSFHRRSLILEPKQEDARSRAYSVAATARPQGESTRNNSVSSIDDRARAAPMPPAESVQVVREKFGHFLKHNAFAFKVTSSPVTPTETLSPVEEQP